MNTKDIPQDWIRDCIEQKLFAALTYREGTKLWEEARIGAEALKSVLNRWREQEDCLD